MLLSSHTTCFGQTLVSRRQLSLPTLPVYYSLDSCCHSFSKYAKAIVASVSEKRWEGHGPDGLGGESGKVEASLTVARQNEAVQSLIDLAQKHSSEVVIAAIGPLTNIALAILLDPNFLSHVKTLVVACAGPTINSCQYDLTGHSPSNSAFH
ncbi:hypothetical protein PsorP6_011572 [Peronosclerospora sorghi]|uniref:Uncharacterized protein n=1 Tax=Peronosclerospora sorghi TaxID=230839 RepID=A0ACC0WJM0_9STRA|nr:hypothetical protein PsorP6_011572 [Peronosclerospora sorghi]